MRRISLAVTRSRLAHSALAKGTVRMPLQRVVVSPVIDVGDRPAEPEPAEAVLMAEVLDAAPEPEPAPALESSALPLDMLPLRDAGRGDEAEEPDDPQSAGRRAKAAYTTPPFQTGRLRAIL